MECPNCKAKNAPEAQACQMCGAELRSADETASQGTDELTPLPGALKPGEKFAGRYVIAEELGRGGMGVVYKARDTRLDRFVALKLLPPDLTRDPEARQRFVQEARAASALEHPNICNIHEIDQSPDGRSYISMACYEGETLKQRLKRGRLDVRDAVAVAAAVADGLDEAHRRGIVHRDIKPANIMITHRGRTRIMDFGLAKLAGQTGITRAGTALGTIAYMSPEQARGDDVDARTDIWSLGVILYEMVTGRRPFRGERPQAVINGILHEDPVPVSRLVQSIPPALAAVIARSIAKHAGDRFPAMADALRELRNIQQELESGASSAAPVFQRLRGSTRVWLTVGAVSALVALLLIVKSRFLGKPPPSPTVPVAVMYFDNQTGNEAYDYLRKGLAEMVITSLDEAEFLRVLSLQRMFDLLRAAGHADIETVDQAMGLELCKNANVEVMIQGGLIKTGNVFAVNVRMLNVGTQEVLNSFSLRGVGEVSILEHLVDDVAREIKATLASGIDARAREDARIADLTTNSLEAYRHYIAGVEAVFGAYHEEAVANLERALELDPNFIKAKDAYKYLARAHISAGRNDEAMEVIERIKNIRGGLTEEDMLTVLFLEARAGGDVDAAITYLKKLLKLNPDVIWAHFDLGLIYYRYKMMFDQGIAEFRKVLDLDPDGLTGYSSYTYNVLGYAYMRKGDYRQALEAFGRYAALSPNQADPLDSLGEAYRIVGRYDDAVATLEKALEIKPEYCLSHANLGNVYLEKGMYREARAAYGRYLAGSASDYYRAQAHCLIARAWLIAGDYDSAAEHAQLAGDLCPSMVEAPWVLGLCRIQQGRLDRASFRAARIESLIASSRFQPDLGYYHHLMGEIAVAGGRPKTGIDHLKLAANIGSLERIFFMHCLGEAYLEMGEVDLALEQFRGVLEHNPNHARSLLSAARACERGELRREARAHFERFIEVWRRADADRPELAEAREALLRL